MNKILLYFLVIIGLYADKLDYDYIEDEVKQIQLKNNAKQRTATNNTKLNNSKNPPPYAIHTRRIVE